MHPIPHQTRALRHAPPCAHAAKRKGSCAHNRRGKPEPWALLASCAAENIQKGQGAVGGRGAAHATRALGGSRLARRRSEDGGRRLRLRGSAQQKLNIVHAIVRDA